MIAVGLASLTPAGALVMEAASPAEFSSRPRVLQLLHDGANVSLPARETAFIIAVADAETRELRAAAHTKRLGLAALAFSVAGVAVLLLAASGFDVRISVRPRAARWAQRNVFFS